MTLATITWQNGSTTIENLITEVDGMFTDDEQYEFLLWDDGSLSIDGMFTDDKIENDQVRLDLASVRKLRDFLNSAKVTALLDAATS